MKDNTAITISDINPTINIGNNENNYFKYFAAPDIAGFKIVFANIYMIGTADRWVLIDTGLPGFAGKIKMLAEERFGSGATPEAIVLTHGHSDHTGSLEALLKFWDVPVYAHTLELPYLTGLSSYPPPDPAIGGGAMSFMSWIFPIAPIHLTCKIIELREHTFIPDLPDWQIIHTPGHSPGHIALFRACDQVLIAGDAFATVDQNSALAVITQKQELHGPPAYFTCDWVAAKRSVQRLSALQPFTAACGHGIPMHGEKLKEKLYALARHFETLAIPSQGRYVKQPAHTDQCGIIDMPVPVSYYVAKTIAATTLLAIILLTVYSVSEKKRNKVPVFI
jgi:glyoxylase-like metal-dependent hydrolase (beta-lactamase superfamily II)